jgi:hypothetical protein
VPFAAKVDRRISPQVDNRISQRAIYVSDDLYITNEVWAQDAG